MKTVNQNTVYLHDYCPYPYKLDNVEITFWLGEANTKVEGVLTILSADNNKAGHDLVLDGLQLELNELYLNDIQLSENDYTLKDKSLTIPADLLKSREINILRQVVTIHPDKNLALEGLYKSHSMLCTQCEAQGFRRILYYPDRPDVMSRFRVTIEGDAATYPVMLSNGNLIEESRQGKTKRITWEDPFPKPGYLFALVAGKLARIKDSFTTMSGRNIALHMYVEEHNKGKCHHALQSLKQAMRWDEQAYGREYDLDIFQIVATDDFNSGAMENKGLNIFNSECVLAHPDTTTDDDYINIEAIVAHEYFHNWSGNRVTLREWFQLSLKEGFTVFRENQYMASQHSPSTKRIDEAFLISTAQFEEDASPVSHPVRPGSYQQIRNFYTLTVYEKVPK